MKIAETNKGLLIFFTHATTRKLSPSPQRRARKKKEKRNQSEYQMMNSLFDRDDSHLATLRKTKKGKIELLSSSCQVLSLSLSTQ